MSQQSFSTQHILHGACVTHTPEFIHHTNTRAHEYTLHILHVDTAHIHHGVYTAYAPWNTCHTCGAAYAEE